VPMDEAKAVRRAESILYGREIKDFEVAPGQARILVEGHPLDDWFTGVPPGAYLLTARVSTPDQEFSLPTNSVRIEIRR